LLASAINQICARWHSSPAASEVERRVIQWMRLGWRWADVLCKNRQGFNRRCARCTTCPTTRSALSHPKTDSSIKLTWRSTWLDVQVRHLRYVASVGVADFSKTRCDDLP